jgi:predicted permease
VALLTAVVFGLLPALRTAKGSATGAAHDGARRTERSWLNRSLVVGQVATSLVLLVCAGLFVRTIGNLRHISTGFDPKNLVFFRLDTAQLDYSAERLVSLRHEVLERLRSLPGVDAATLTSQSLLTGTANGTSGTLAGGTFVDSVASIIAGADYFDTMGIPIRAGRPLASSDYTGPPVAVVNEAFVRRWLDGREVVGQTFETRFLSPDPIRIVGIVGDTKHARLKDPSPPTIYVAARRGGRPTPVFYVRSATSPEALATAIQEAIASIAPELPSVTLDRQTDVMAREYDREETFAVATSFFGALALAVSMIGLYGVMSYAVVRRTKEIGVRMALGARAGQVLGAVVREALVIVVVGAGIGVALAVATTRFLAGFLYNLSPTDPVAIVCATGVLLAVGTLASLLPAWKAARVNPVIALRQE